MSNFIKELKKLQRGESQPIGFTGRNMSQRKVKIQLIARINAAEADAVAPRTAGADAVIIRVNASHQPPKLKTEALRGGQISYGDASALEALTKAGYDFFVFPVSAPVSLIKAAGEAGKVLEIEQSIPDSLLRTVNEMQADAVLSVATENPSPLTIQQLMQIRRLADFIPSPSLVTVSPLITGLELEALWEAGIMGVVVDINPDAPADTLSNIRKEIDGQEFKPRRSRKTDAIAPRASTPAAAPKHNDDDDDGEDD